MMKKLSRTLLLISRFLFVLLIITGAFVFAMFQGGVVSWTIFYAILPFASYSLLLFFYPLSSFSAKRIVNSTHFTKGDTLKVEVVLTRKWPFPLLYTVIHDEWQNGSDFVEKRQALRLFGWKKSLTWGYKVEQLPRGEHLASAIAIEVTDFFGWIQKKKIVPIVNTVLVYPKVEQVHYSPLKSQYAGDLPVTLFNMLKEPNVVTGVRDYEEGDRMSWVHWKSFARTGMLMTKEFDDRGSEDLHLLFDNRVSDTFEEQVSFGASIVQALQKERLSIQFLPIHQTEPILAVQSNHQYQSALMYLAKVQPVQVDRMIPLPSLKKVLEQDSATILITGNMDQCLLSFMKAHIMQRSVTCFVVLESEQSMTSSIRKEIKDAASKGISIQLIRSCQFTDAFKEVVSSE